jgi:uncharacterized protein
MALVNAIHSGDVNSLRVLLAERSGLAAARLVDEKGGCSTALHSATDWPGFFPNGPEVVALLIDAGADPNAPVEGSWHKETPLHWAASSDDVEVARALIDHGADIEAPGASIAGGTPLDDAVGYGCWQVAALGADLNGTPSWGDDTPLGIAGSVDTGREALVNWLRERGATSSTQPAT